MTIKIFHTADLHLGMKFTRGYPPEVQESLIQARFETLQGMIESANQQGCDLFVIAGDLFDNRKVPKKDVLLGAETLKRFEGSCILILPGNHDYIQKGEDNLWTIFRGAMSERILILENPTCYDLRAFDIDMVVYASPCTAKHSKTNAIGWIREYPKDPNAKFHIGIAHGSLEGVSPDFDGDYYPMSNEELRALKMDLWLMGHTHIRYPDKVKGDGDRILFPSTPEPDGFDCSHPGYAWIIELKDDKSISYQSVQTGEYQFITMEKELLGEKDVNGLKLYFYTLNRERHLVKLKLKGRIPGGIYDERNTLLKEVNSCVLYLEPDLSELLQEITQEDIDREFTEGSFPHRLLGTLAQEQKNPSSLQIAYGLIREVKS
jgi:DNA repair exonuclease SbcCD nuclease subunit